MALSFNQQKGKAQKSSAPSFKFEDGDNVFRIVGDILPRYVYWIKNGSQNVPMECLAFDRDTESFIKGNVEDPVQEFYPDLKCSWAYLCQAIDPKDGTIKVVNLKKKMWEQICTTAEDLGDPTDPDTGWDIHVKKVKTGPKSFNVEYAVQQLRCKPRALTDAERAAVAEMKSIDEVMPRPTVEVQRKFLARINSSDVDSSTDAEVVGEEFDVE